MGMQKFRVLLLITIAVFFVVCYSAMNTQYDPLARYPYATDSNRDEILASISKQDIQLIIDEDIRPEQFLPFVKSEEFTMKNTVAYYQISLVSEEKKATVVSFANQSLKSYSLPEILVYLEAYSFSNIIDWINYKDEYSHESVLVANPIALDTVLDEINTVGRYQPKHLEQVSALSTLISQDEIYLESQTNKNLNSLCEVLQSEFEEKCGGLIGVQGFVSFDKQRSLYDEHLLSYGPDMISRYFNFPGHNESQLGNTITVLVARSTESSFYGTKQYKWLVDHAHEYGFVIRYRQGKEDITKKKARSNQLRYVGKELAKYMYDNNLALEETKVEK